MAGENRFSIRRSIGSTVPTTTHLVDGEVSFTEGTDTLYYRDSLDVIRKIGGRGAFLFKEDNLSDLPSVAAARGNLELGTAALVDTGTGEGDVPVLNSSGKLSSGVIPAVALSEVFPVADIAARDLLTVQQGDVAIVADATADPEVTTGGASYIYDDAEWLRLVHPSDLVESFNGRIGVVVPENDDYTWAQINKTVSDIADITDRSHTDLQDIGTNTHAQIDTHIASSANPHGTTLELARAADNELAGDVDFAGHAILGAVIDGGTY